MTENPHVAVTRRELFQRAGMGLGGAALSSLLAQNLQAASDPLSAQMPHAAPRARSVIYIHLVGAPSHLDLYDYKPELKRREGQLMPDKLWEGLRLAFIRKRPALLGTPFKFSPRGKSGLEMSELLPHLGGVADDLCIIKTLKTEQFNHAPAQLHLLTGFARFGRPSFGSWVTYGLGSENGDLPGFVVLITGNVLGAGNSGWGSGFLPSVYQGVEFRSQGDPVLFLSDPPGIEREDRRAIVTDINRLNEVQRADVGDPEIATRIRQYELAYRMQSSVPELMDISKEPKAVHRMYGTQPGKKSFANNCLLARRLVERGVRCVQLFDQGWDHHNNIQANLPKKCKQVDQPIAALIRDLKARGLLDQTLVVWSSEFGRTPMVQTTGGSGETQKAGRDHHKDAFSVWMAGGGVKGGISYGKTDDLGFSAAENPVDIHDFNATMLHLLGMDHERLTFRYQGREFRLTDVFGNVVHDILA